MRHMIHCPGAYRVLWDLPLLKTGGVIPGAKVWDVPEIDAPGLDGVS